MPAAQPDDYLTSAQVAVLLRTTQGTVSRWARNGQIAGKFVEGRWLIPRAAVEPVLAKEQQARAWRAAPTVSAAKASRAAATAQLVAAAAWWREHPDDVDAIAALKAAVDARSAMVMKTSPGP